MSRTNTYVCWRGVGVTKVNPRAEGYTLDCSPAPPHWWNIVHSLLTQSIPKSFGLLPPPTNTNTSTNPNTNNHRFKDIPLQ